MTILMIKRTIVVIKDLITKFKDKKEKEGR